MKRKGLILAVLAAIVAAVMGLAACNGNGNGNGGNGDDTAPVQYTISFETNGGSTVDSITAESGDSITLPTPEKPYFNFVGWFDNAAFDGNKLPSPYTPTANVTLYAKWETAQYTVSFETDGGIAAVDTVTVNGGKSVDLPTPEKTYFNFVGWFDNAAFNGNKLPSPYFPTANMTLYAKWEEIVDTAEEYFTFEEIKENSDTVIGYSVSLVSGKVPSRIFVPISYKGEPVLTIKANGFANENIKDLIIPDSVTEIESGAFSGCNNLEKITLPFVGRYADVSKDGATHFGYVFGASSFVSNSTAVPAKLKTVVVNGGNIGDYVFRGCSDLTSITIPDSVTSIGDSAFRGCSGLTSITIPDSVTSIGSDAFRDCGSLTSITLPFVGASATEQTNTHFGYIFGASYYNSNDDYVPEKLKTVVVTGGSICDYAFYGCSSLTSITIPDSVTSIGGHAFEYCRGLTSITVPDSVTSIGEYAFRDCSRLTSVTIGSKVTSIGDFAFYNCSKLIEVYNLSSLDITVGSETHGYVAKYAKTVHTSASTASKITTTADGYMFYDDNSSCCLIGYNGTDTKLTLPNDYNGKNYAIYDNAFYNCDGLTSVTIPDSVTSIGSNAFLGCGNLTSITLPNSVTSIGDSAFLNCNSLTSITIPDSVTSIGDSAFEWCSSLTSITIPNFVTSIGARAFLQCSSLTSVIVPNTVTSIGDSAFYFCRRLTSVTIGSGVKSIGTSAFQYCYGLTSITIGSDVKTIGSSAFAHCYTLIEVNNLSSLDITAGSTAHGYVAYYAKNVYTPTSGASKITTADGYLFYTDNGKYYLVGYNGTDTVLTLPNGYNGKDYAIYDDAFYGCSGLTSITIPNTVASIGNYAFSGCSGLTSITIPDTVTSIGNYAFRNCTSLTSITIPNTVTTIGSSVFENCSGLTSITIPDSVTSIGDSAFSSCRGLTSVTIGSGVKSIGNSAFKYCRGLTSIIIPDSVTSIGIYAFEYCGGLTSVTIGKSVTSINSNFTFYYCYKLIEVYNLSSLDIKAGSTRHGYVAYYARNVYTSSSAVSKITTTTDGYMFYNDNGSYYLIGYNGTDTNLTLPNGYNGKNYAIYDYAFYDCDSLTSVTIPNSVTSIGKYAFKNCHGLISVTIGSGVNTIGESAFSSCSGLTEVYYTGDIAEWCGISFSSSSSNPLSYAHNPLSYARNLYINDTLVTELTIPDSVKSIGSYTFGGCSSLAIVTIPDSVTSIGKYAFEYCSSLASVTIGSGVKSIGSSAFSNCGDLTSVTIGSGVTSIGNYAFFDCSKLTSITIPDSVKSIGSSAFTYCSGLTSITVAAENTTYKSSGNCIIEIATSTLIVGCKTSVIPTDGSVKSIGNWAFSGCSKLTSITIPNTVKSIGESAFRYCSGLTSITIPNTVKTIGGIAFENCSGLTSITFNGAKAQWKAISKGSDWARYTPSFTVACTDGTLTKSEAGGNK